MFRLFVVATLILAGSAQDATCGREGQTPCSSGCVADSIPPAASNPEDFYTEVDNYVPAPSGYRVQEGLCTRCGNLYEPVCPGGNGQAVCFAGLQSSEVLVPSKDGYCIPKPGQVGCGTYGKPPCPMGIVNEMGTLVVMSKPDPRTNKWSLTASIGEIADHVDGCIYSEHNTAFRFVKASIDWLPDGHDCADVCVHCGNVNEPACPSMPRCKRRRSLTNTQAFLDGPMYSRDDVCHQHLCGAMTLSGPMPACTDAYELSFDGRSLDETGDGCAEPFKADASGMCSEIDEGFTSANDVTILDIVEDGCVEPGVMKLDAGTLEIMQNSGVIPVDTLRDITVGSCIACGGNVQPPCPGMDFGGCFVNQGFIRNEVGICTASPCGAESETSAATVAAPFNSPACPIGNLTSDQIPDDWLNDVNSCLYLHNSVQDASGEQVCQACGWPGNPCRQECLYIFEWAPAGPEPGVGRYRVRPDLRDPDHCSGLVARPLYPDNCLDPYADPYAAPGAPIFSPNGPNSPQYGTEAHVDHCQRNVTDVVAVYTTACPGGGGSPVAKYGQCGGADYSGPTCCFGYAVCVQKSEFYSQCEDANIPAGLIPWHMACGVSADDGACEMGSTCRDAPSGAGKFCVPDAAQVVLSPHQVHSRGRSSAAIFGIIVGVLVLVTALAAGGYVLYKRRAQGGVGGGFSGVSMRGVGSGISQYTQGFNKLWTESSYVAQSQARADGVEANRPADTGEFLEAGTESLRASEASRRHVGDSTSLTSPQHIHLPSNSVFSTPGTGARPKVPKA